MQSGFARSRRAAWAAALALTAGALVLAPAASAQTVQVLPLEQFEGTFPPDGWAVTNDDPPGGPVLWHRSDATPNYGAADYAPFSGFTAYAESYPAYCGYSYDTSLVTPAFSTEGIPGGPLWVVFDYQYWLYSSEVLALDYRIGAGPWTNVTNLASLGGYTGQTMQIDISAALGYADVQLRWRYYNLGSGCDWWTNVDNVYVFAEVPPQAIPAASTWGLVLIGALTAGFALIALRRRG